MNVRVKKASVTDIDLSWPDDWYDVADHPTDAARCRSMWADVFRASLVDDVMDARHQTKIRASGAPPPMPAWIGGTSALEVASLAGFDPQALVGRARARFASWEALDALYECLRPKNSERRA